MSIVSVKELLDPCAQSLQALRFVKTMKVVEMNDSSGENLCLISGLSADWAAI